jgi:tetraacyldisaccharide 4'-kinase
MKLDPNQILQRIRNWNRRCPVFFFSQKLGPLHTPSGSKPLAIDSVKDRKVGVVAAIGNPEQFARDLETAGLSIGIRFLFRDHHPFTSSDIKKIASQCRSQGIDTIITTEKDLVRLEKLDLSGLAVRSVELQIFESGGGDFDSWILEKIGSPPVST